MKKKNYTLGEFGQIIWNDEVTRDGDGDPIMFRSNYHNPGEQRLNTLNTEGLNVPRWAVTSFRMVLDDYEGARVIAIATFGASWESHIDDVAKAIAQERVRQQEAP